eukprot:CAMPEP_0201505442 /NCGR_PEP_ID=MMETSP0151_2-20130828/85775_1 /ASSEMBLY_ACC=CAM_ASM_000257 /TAXON_ID=200890 /ORGANISM="Paramoeba atlantica, Strain 621/1 / CCAP 1560/9" /LENGTH=120 /DNA_ID=CAMNT_0047899313 /DNA_START=181 /DNA_END=540 /DNA_ORIENTATION=+
MAAEEELPEVKMEDYDGDDDDDDDALDPPFLVDTHHRPSPMTSSSLHPDNFVNVGYQTWLSTREHWRRRPPNYDRNATLEMVKKSMSELEFEKVQHDLISGKKPVKAPLPVVIQTLVAQW